MTPLSLTPEQARHVGIDFPELCRWIVEQARCGG
jgi:D-alanine-D-alanine ligase